MGLPIKYYDTRVLTFIGNRVGRVIKVDKNTMQHERGKYARICVQVNLSKPLLAFFSIKDRKYRIEYEGLHLLFLRCGRYGYYKEGCGFSGKGNDQSSSGHGSKEKRITDVFPKVMEVNIDGVKDGS